MSVPEFLNELDNEENECDACGDPSCKNGEKCGLKEGEAGEGLMSAEEFFGSADSADNAKPKKDDIEEDDIEEDEPFAKSAFYNCVTEEDKKEDKKEEKNSKSEKLSESLARRYRKANRKLFNF